MNMNKCNSSQCTVETVIDSKRINILACLFFPLLFRHSFPFFYVAAFAEGGSQVWAWAWKDWTCLHFFPLNIFISTWQF